MPAEARWHWPAAAAAAAEGDIVAAPYAAPPPAAAALLSKTSCSAQPMRTQAAKVTMRRLSAVLGSRLMTRRTYAQMAF